MAHSGPVLTESELRAASIAERQSGLVTRSDLIAAGMSSATISRRVERGELIRRRPGVYAFAGTPALVQQQLVAEVLSVDPRAAASHDSAAHLWGLITSEPPQFHVVVRRWRREIRTTARVHESLDFVPKDRVWKDGIPLTNPTRTIVDLGATSKWLVEAALSRGLRSGILDIAEIEAFVRRVARRGRRGVGVIRPLLEFHSTSGGTTESPLEDMFMRLIHDSGLPAPVPQFVVREPSGEPVSRADFAYPSSRLLVELDGRDYHSDPDAFQADRAKQNRTQFLGWMTLRFTWFDVTQRPDHTVLTVQKALHRWT